MEVVVFLALMIVPILSVVALVLAVMNNRRIKSMKALTLKLLRAVDGNHGDAHSAYNDYMVGEL